MTTDISNWTPRPRPTNAPMHGHHIDVLPWNRDAHGEALWNSFGDTEANALIFHFGWPQMQRWQDLADILDGFNDSGEFVTCIFCDKTNGAPLGMASYMSIVPEHGVVETGAIAHSPHLARTRAATEAHYLMAKRAFDELGYRRYEWKLNNPNQPSHRAAQRFGFTFEGVFRQHQVKPYGNRDTAWYSMLDSEWPQVKCAFETWLDDSNFNATGQQRVSLSELNTRHLPISGKTFQRCSFDEALTITAFQRQAFGRIAHYLDNEPIPMGWDYAAMMSECQFWRLGEPAKPDAIMILRLRNDDLYLESVATSDHLAGQGLGRLMLEAATERAKTLDRGTLRLITNAKNPAASWYERAGFAVEQREDRPGRVILHFAKTL